jgi:hypothetical protein
VTTARLPGAFSGANSGWRLIRSASETFDRIAPIGPAILPVTSQSAPSTVSAYCSMTASAAGNGTAIQTRSNDPSTGGVSARPPTASAAERAFVSSVSTNAIASSSVATLSANHRPIAPAPTTSILIALR